MRVLVTGGSGVVGRSTVTALLQRGHVVQLLSRHARRDAEQWTNGVHPFVGNIASAETITGAADACEAVIHLAAVVDERGADTFDRINVEGTRNVLREAERAGARQFVFLSSLGADRGQSRYHSSKRMGEAIARQFRGAWTVVRCGNVYGPGDGQISLLLRMVRTWPVLPILGNGDQRFQPIWHDDIAEALARTIERDDLGGKELEVAGAELTTQNDLVERLARITGRRVPQVGVPEMLTKVGLRLASAVGMGVPFNESQLTMLAEGNEVAAGRENALVTEFGLQPMALDRGLEILANAQDEQLPDDGVGPLRRKRYRADIHGGSMSPEDLMNHVQRHFGDLIASFIDARFESGVNAKLEEGETITLSLPLRGQVQVRVADVEPRTFTLVTLSGHPLSGSVRFLSERRGDDVRFEVQVFERAADVLDLLLMRAWGERLEDASWREMVENVVRATGGVAVKGVEQETESLDDAQAERVEEWLRDLVMERKREEAGI